LNNTLKQSITSYLKSDDKLDEYTQSEKKNFLNKLQHLNKTFVHQNSKNTSTAEETAKISYKHMQRIDLVLNSSKETVSTNAEVERFFWFGAYDKLINYNNLVKVLKFYNEEPQAKIVR
jgi:predicted nucleic acid-binding protein